MKSPKRRKPRKKSLPYWLAGDPRLWTIGVNGVQLLFQVSRWRHPLLLGTVPQWGGLLEPMALFRCLFPKERFPVKRPTESSRTPALYAAPVDDLVDGLQLLADHMALTAFEGEPPGSRPTSSVLLFADDGVWKAMLKDKVRGKCLWVACPSLLDVFNVLEAALADPGAIWRDDRHAGHDQARRNKPNKPT